MTHISMNLLLLVESHFLHLTLCPYLAHPMWQAVLLEGLLAGQMCSARSHGASHQIGKVRIEEGAQWCQLVTCLEWRS